MVKIVLLALCVLVFTTADYFATRWGHNRNLRSLGLTLLIGPFAYLLFGYLAATTSLSKMGAYVNGGIVLGSVAAGYFLLAERPNRTTWIAIGLIVVGITMLSAGRVARGGG